MKYVMTKFMTAMSPSDTLDTRTDSSGQRSRGHDDGCGRRFTHDNALDKMPPISGCA